MDAETYILLKTLGVGFALITCGFLLGRNYWMNKATSQVVNWLCDNKYVKYTVGSDNDIVLHKLNEK